MTYEDFAARPEYRHLGGGTPAVLRRSDGRLQVGVGPWAVLLEGWEQGGDAEAAALRIGAGFGRPGPRPRSRQVPAGAAVRGDSTLATRLGSTLDTGADAEHPDTLVVVVSHHVIPPETGVRTARSGQVTLPVVIQTGRVVVGPVCRPEAGPCLHCLDRHRRDRDADWPTVASRLAHPLSQLNAPTLDPSVSHTAEGLCRLLVLGVLAGDPPPDGLAIEVGPQRPHVVTRQWTRHPTCPMHRDREQG